MVLDVAIESEKENVDAATLILEICQLASEAPENFWNDSLGKMFPRTIAELQKLRNETKPWRCGDKKLHGLVMAALKGLRERYPRAEWSLLPYKVRHNAVDVTTSGEMLSYPTSQLSRLSGLALYGWAPNTLNHSNTPNVARWHCGDVGVWKLIRDVQPGEELCIAYVASELLTADAAHLRREMLAHFEPGVAEDHDEPKMKKRDRLLDAEAQDLILSNFSPSERLRELAELKNLLSCDELQRWILIALSHAETNDASNARRAFVEALQLAKRILPPLDEQIIVLGLHAARAALASYEPQQARHLLFDAVKRHNLLFSGGIGLFMFRFYDDILLGLGYHPNPSPNQLYALFLDHDDSHDDFLYIDDDDSNSDDSESDDLLLSRDDDDDDDFGPLVFVADDDDDDDDFDDFDDDDDVIHFVVDEVKDDDDDDDDFDEDDDILVGRNFMNDDAKDDESLDPFDEMGDDVVVMDIDEDRINDDDDDEDDDEDDNDEDDDVECVD